MTINFKQSDAEVRCAGCRTPFIKEKPAHRFCKSCWGMMMVAKHTSELNELLAKSNQ